MANKFFVRLFGSRNQRMVRKLRGLVAVVNGLESKYRAMSDEELGGQTQVLRDRLAAGSTLEDLQADAFAVVREAAWRVLQMRHFDVQIIGGAVLHQGRISEMKTGEGKTLVATLPVYLNALPAKGAHVVTVNDYLARRDAEWMGRIYRFLNMSVGVIVAGQTQEEKREAYACDITYGTNNEYGFDYLRDNMAFMQAEKVQRPLHFAIVDEVDSILIDEARTPLIISGPTDEDTALYRRINALIPRLVRQEEEEGPGDFSVDEKTKAVHLTEAGHEKVEELLRQDGLLGEEESLYDASRIVLMHHLNALLRGHHLYKRDVEYIVRGGQVIIVDEFTGRIMVGRRWSEGLHQAIEAKENVAIQQENQTLASITFQNYFRLYKKLAGMTGTADTEAFEFQSIYGLEVVVIPTNRSMVRDDRPDLVYMTAREKFEAVVNDISDGRGRGQAILVGTASIETSELLSGMLREKGVAHEVLNAKQHDREAEIIAQAGSPGAVTIATNMAGRGTDIVLGGSLEAELAKLAPEDSEGQLQVRAAWKERHDEALAAGGLYVIGSERHESRRIDNQLRGRSGRQGDPGATRFYLSLEDTLMRIFTPPHMRTMLQRMGMQEGEALEHRWVTRAIETAQRKVEAHNFDLRKNLLEYDDVANEQRKVIYELRDELMAAERITPMIEDIRNDVVKGVIDTYLPPQSMEEMWNLEGLEEVLQRDFGVAVPVRAWMAENTELEEAELRTRVVETLARSYEAKKAENGAEIIEHFEKVVALQVLDTFWREHLAAMDYLRQGIHLRGYAQRDPKQEYKREAFTMFNEMLARFKQDVISKLWRMRLQTEADLARVEQERRTLENLQYQHAEAPAVAVAAEGAMPLELPPGLSGEAMPALAPARRSLDTLPGAPRPETFVRDERKVGRNEPCPCGSGKKYKNCHGRLT
jgi:preprotein translocase subunit SecA